MSQDDDHKIEAFRRIVEDEVLTTVFRDLEEEYLNQVLTVPFWNSRKRSRMAEAIKIVRAVRNRIETMYDAAQAMKRAQEQPNP